MKTIVLYSAGLDSTTVLAMELATGEDVLALTFDYGQTNPLEIEKCKVLANWWGFPHKIVKVPLERTDPRLEVPARNTIFLAKALECALIEKADRVAFGAEPEDVYTDSSKQFVEAMRKVFELHKVALAAPLQTMRDKDEVLKTALDHGVPLDLVQSSRTNYVNGGCKTSRRFLLALHKALPAFHPVELLQTISDTNKEVTNPYDFATAYNEFAEWMAPHDDWAIKQALGRLPRARYLPCGLAFRDEQGHIAKAAADLGYNVSEGPDTAGMPLTIN
jgi:7-cyano-7-deazaguanine synthase